MRHRKASAKLGRTSSHRRAMISNMMTSLFRHERIKTTVDRAKEARRFAEKTITVAKKNTLHARRLAFRRIKDEEVLDKLFAEIAPRFAERNGGYTRIVRIGHRTGDGSEMAYLELVDRVAPAPEKESRKAAAKKKPEQEEAGAGPAAAEAAQAEAKAAEKVADEERETPAGEQSEDESAEDHDSAQNVETGSAAEDEEKEDGPEQEKK